MEGRREASEHGERDRRYDRVDQCGEDDLSHPPQRTGRTRVKKRLRGKTPGNPG